jgi:5-formyltetrahydrofolate cyclo-ligase
MQPVRVQKRALRREMVARLLAMAPCQRRAQNLALAQKLAGLPGFATAQTVLIYVTAFPEEIVTAPLMRLVLELGKTLVCPRVEPAQRRLVSCRVELLGADLAPGTLGIPEPRPSCPGIALETIDWVLVPGLAFDDQGYRLGRGAGYYDRFLPLLRPETPRWALALEPQWVSALPIEPHDQPLDGVASSARLQAFDRRAHTASPTGPLAR